MTMKISTSETVLALKYQRLLRVNQIWYLTNTYVWIINQLCIYIIPIIFYRYTHVLLFTIESVIYKTNAKANTKAKVEVKFFANDDRI